LRDVMEQTFGDFLERQLGTRPRQAFGGAQYVHHRWLMEPWGCFVAEEDSSKIVGAALAVTWGTVGVLGPVAVLTNYHNQTIGQQLIRAAQDFFDENKATLHGCVTYPTSPKHLYLYHKFGYRPKQLTAIMSRAIDRGPARVSALAKAPVKTPLTARRFSTLIEGFGQELGVQRVILPVYARYWVAYNVLIQCGYQIDFTMIRMQRGKQEDYEDPADLVLDDWR